MNWIDLENNRLLEFLLVSAFIVGSHGAVIDCEFGIESHVIGDVYTCKAIKLWGLQNEEAVEEITGAHASGMTNIDVQVLHIDDLSFDHFPSDLENFFPGLEGIKIVSSGLKSLSQNNLQWFPDLQFCDFTDNEIETLDADLFKFNSKLKYVTFDSNKIISIDGNVFELLSELESISMKNNECIDDSWVGNEEIAKAKTEIAEKCSKKVETPVEEFKDADGSSTSPTESTPETDESSQPPSEIHCEFSETFWHFFGSDQFTCTIANSPIKHPGYNVKVSLSEGEKVTVFSLNDNQYVKFLPANVGSAFPNLLEYSVINTYLESISATDFEGLGNLKKLNLSDNDLSVIESGTFAALTNLEQLDLSDGDIRFIEEGAFAGLSSLQALNLEANKLRFLLPKTFEGLTELRNLSIELNHLTDIDDNLFVTNTKLVNIWLNGNKINILNPKAFEGLSELAFIDLQDNECIDEDYEPSNFDEMNTVLDEKCSSTETSTEIIIERTVRKKFKVKHGDEETHIDVRDENHSLETLYTFVQDVEVSEMEPAMETTTSGESKVTEVTTIKNVPQDKTVSCTIGEVFWRFSDTNLKTCVIADQLIDAKDFKIADQSDGSDIKGLVMSNNKLMKFLPENIGQVFPNLREFTAQNLSLVHVSKSHFEGLHHLKTLSLANNQIKFIESDAFDDLKDLEELDLSGNSLENIDEEIFAKLKNLKVLRLSENKLHFVHPKLLRNLRNLQNISISSNQISTIDENLFKTNQKLNNVWLQNNKIKSLSPNIFGKLKALEYIDLRDNKCIDAVYETTVFEVMKKELLAKCGDGYALKRGAKIKKSERKKKEKTTKKPDSDEYDNSKEVGCEYEDLYWPSLNVTLFTCVVTAYQSIDEVGFRMVANAAPYNLPLINGDHVQALKFEPNKKIKFLPEKIAKTFPNLIAFSAVDTSLDSISKKHFKKLAKVRSVNLSGNQIKSFDQNTFEDMDELEELILDDNEFEVMEEETIINTRTIKRLKMAGNKLKQVEPESFELLSELVELSFDFETPSQDDESYSRQIFDSNDNLEVLTLNGKSFGRDLKVIDPTATESSTTSTTSTGSSTEGAVVDEMLQEISCSFSTSSDQNLFTCELDDEIEISDDSNYVIKESVENTKVERFVVSRDLGLKSLPKNLAEVFPNLVEISVTNSGLTGVDKESLSGLKSLRVLDLSSNHIKHLEPETLESLEKLEVLNLSDNSMEFIEESLLQNLRNLKDLKLSSNKIHYLHPKTLKFLDNLETFAIDNNFFSVLEPSTFKHNRKLQVIDLSRNKIDSLDPKLFDLKDLTTVNLEQNNCIDQSFTFSTISELKQAVEEKCKPTKENDLVGCDVDDEGISCTVSDQPIDDPDYSIHIRSPVSTISGPTIQRLIFDGAEINFLPKMISEVFPNLIEISAINAPLTSIGQKTFMRLPKLKSLRLKVSELSDPNIFKGLTSLETLIIETDAEDIDENIFDDLVSLEIFFLTGTNLRKVPKKLFENLSELTEVELSFHPTVEDIVEIEASLIKKPSLRKLNINGRDIELKERGQTTSTATDVEEPLNLDSTTQHTRTEASSTYKPDFSGRPTTNDQTTSGSRPTSRTKPTRGQRPVTTERPDTKEVMCSLSYHEWSEPNETLITCDVLSDQKIEDAETSLRPTPYSNHVQALRIEDNKQVKFLPENIAASSPNLLRLSAKNSSLEAIFKEDFESLKKLKDLNLSDNKIESIEPETFVDLFSLESLELNDNEIDYVDENAFANLSSLKTLDLSNNKIGFLHPQTFAKLPQLQSINLEGNNLPEDFEETLRRSNPNLVHIKISIIRNRVDSTTTEKIIHHETAESLPCTFSDVYWFFADSNLFSCDLKGEISDINVAIEQSPRNRRVKGVNFVDNKNIKYFPRNLGDALPNIVGISGFNSSLQSILPSDLNNLKKLKYLNLAKNNLKEIPLNTFDHLTSLEELDLSDNEISELDESTFEKLTSLQTLYLGGNNLEHLPNNLFTFLPNLRNLSLENNRIVNIDVNLLRNNPKLQNVWMNGNRIKVVGDKTFEGLSYLEYVDFQRNDCIDQFFEGSRIEQLRLEILKGCQVEAIRTEPATFRPDTKPSILQIQSTEATAAYEYEDNGPSRVDPNEEIEILHSIAKKLSCDFGETFSTVTNSHLFTCKIEHQSIDGNDFSIKDVPQNSRVKRTIIDSKNANYLPQNVGESFPHLQEFEVTNSSLKTVSPQNFLNLRNLKVLILSGNELKFIEPETFDELSSLEVLDLSDNKLHCLEEPNLRTLRIFNIDGNQLSYLDPKVFSKLWELVEVNLENNQLKEINGDLFQHNPKLEVVNLANNKIKSVDPAVVERSPSLRIVNLSFNLCIDKVFDDTSMQTFRTSVQQSCQTYEDLHSLFTTCRRESESCRIDQATKMSSRRDESLRKENEKLRALLSKTGVKVEKLNTHIRKLRNSLTYDRNMARKLKAKIRKIEAENENLKSSFQSCAKTDDENNFLVSVDCDFEETADDAYSCNAKNLQIQNENSFLENVSGNHIREKRNADVTALTIKDQSVKFIPSGISETFPNLNKLDIENSDLRRITPGGFKGLILLVNLVIRDNKIASIEPKSFDDSSNLELLDLSKNNIEKLSPMIFEKLTKLVILNLSDNKIKSLAFDIIPSQNILEQFKLEKNQLETIDPRIFKRLARTIFIDFSGNVCVDGKYSEADGDDQQLSLFGEIAMKCSEDTAEFCKA